MGEPTPQAAHLHLKHKGHWSEDSVKPFFLLQYCAKYSPQTLIYTPVETVPLMGTPIQWFLWAFNWLMTLNSYSWNKFPTSHF